MKTYNSPMLQVIGITNIDIVTTSKIVNIEGESDTQLAPGMRGIYDPYNAGY